MSPRQVTPNGLGSRTTLELSGTERHAIGLGPSKQDLLWVREHWAEVTNGALRKAGLPERIDHRGLRGSSIDREPVLRLPLRIFHMERRSGLPTQVGDHIRREHRERTEARQKGPDELARVLRRQKDQGRERIHIWLTSPACEVIDITFAMNLGTSRTREQCAKRIIYKTANTSHHQQPTNTPSLSARTFSTAPE